MARIPQIHMTVRATELEPVRDLILAVRTAVTRGLYDEDVAAYAALIDIEEALAEFGAAIEPPEEVDCG